MTKEEMHLWLDFLKKCPYSVRRQKVIGNYILDFYIPEAKLAIELDGRQHGREETRSADRERDSFLEEKGIKVLRYTNVQINELFQAFARIYRSTTKCEKRGSNELFDPYLTNKTTNFVRHKPT